MSRNTQIPRLTPVNEWPTRKLPQERFDDAVRTAMNQMSGMVGELNDDFIPAVNGIVDDVNAVIEHLPAIEAAPGHAADASAAAEAARVSADSAAKDALRARQAADEAAAIAGVNFSLVPMAGAVPLAGDDARIDPGWLPEDFTGCTVMQAPEVKGNELVAIGHDNPFSARAVPGLLNTRIAKFVITANGGVPFEAAAVDNACDFTVSVPEGTEAGIVWPVSVHAVDTMGNRSAVTTLSPVTSPSRVMRPKILSPAAQSSVGATTAQVVPAAFACVGMQDTQAAAQYQVLGAASSVIYDSGELTDEGSFASHTINVPDEADISGTCSLRARQKGATLGWSEWSEAVPVSITRDYVVLVDDYLKTAFSLDGIHYERPVAEKAAFFTFSPRGMTEGHGKIVVYVNEKVAVSENGTDWTEHEIPISCNDIISVPTGFMAYNFKSYCLSPDGREWGEVTPWDSSYGSVRSVLYMESTRLYLIAWDKDTSAGTSKASSLSASGTVVAGRSFSKSGSVLLARWGDDGVLFLMQGGTSTSYLSTYWCCSRNGGETFTPLKEIAKVQSASLSFPPKRVASAFVARANGIFTGTSYKTGYYVQTMLDQPGIFIEEDIDIGAAKMTPVLHRDASEGQVLWGGKYSARLAAGAVTPETVSMPFFPFYGGADIYSWSELLQKYVFACERVIYFLDDFRFERPLTVTSAIEGGKHNGSIMRLFREGHEWTAKYGGTSVSDRPNSLLATKNGGTFRTSDYGADISAAEVGRVPSSCKAFGKYVYIDLNGKVAVSDAPDALGSPLPSQPPIPKVNTMLLFTGEQLAYFDPPQKSFYRLAGLAKAWSAAVAMPGTPYSVSTDGMGKIAAVLYNAGKYYVSTSSDHGARWTSMVEWASFTDSPGISRVMGMIDYVDGVWLAWGSSNIFVSTDALAWELVPNAWQTSERRCALAADGRIIIPTWTGVLLFDRDTKSLEAVNLGNFASKVSILGTY